MNETLITNHNDHVQFDDEVYFVGDFAFLRPHEAEAVIKRLNGRKFLVRGNHDSKMDPCVAKHFVWVKDYFELKVTDKTKSKGQQLIILMHYAMKVWNKSHHGSWQLYGHSHGNLPDDPNSLSIDVGVDNHNYCPISYDHVKQIMKKKTFKPIDGHGAKRV